MAPASRVPAGSLQRCTSFPRAVGRSTRRCPSPKRGEPTPKHCEMLEATASCTAPPPREARALPHVMPGAISLERNYSPPAAICSSGVGARRRHSRGGFEQGRLALDGRWPPAPFTPVQPSSLEQLNLACASIWFDIPEHLSRLDPVASQTNQGKVRVASTQTCCRDGGARRNRGRRLHSRQRERSPRLFILLPRHSQR